VFKKYTICLCYKSVALRSTTNDTERKELWLVIAKYIIKHEAIPRRNIASKVIGLLGESNGAIKIEVSKN
jgi:hypothetical protein